jgi:hypothetical protein
VLIALAAVMVIGAAAGVAVAAKLTVNGARGV